MKNRKRLAEHKKNENIEEIFLEIKELLSPVESQILERYQEPNKPVILIVGCARSGSTLLYQFLAESGYFAYPSNLMSRFFYAPYLGARIQQMLIDFDFKGEVFSKLQKEYYTSSLGKTFGPDAPHEFWYFWDRFFKFGELQQLNDDQLRHIDWTCFNRELHAIESVFDKPIVMKAMKLNWHLDALLQRLPNVHFVQIKRDVLFNAQSLLMAREKFFGTMEEWYSFKPRDFLELSRLAPAQQVVEQVLGTNKIIEEQISEFPADRFTVVEYESFCSDPGSLLSHLAENVLKLELDSNLSVTSTFENGNFQKIEPSLFEELKAYIATRV